VTSNHHKIGAVIVEQGTTVASTFSERKAVEVWEKNYHKQTRDSSSESDVRYHGNPRRKGWSGRSSQSHIAIQPTKTGKTSRGEPRRAPSPARHATRVIININPRTSQRSKQ